MFKNSNKKSKKIKGISKYKSKIRTHFIETKILIYNMYIYLEEKIFFLIPLKFMKFYEVLWIVMKFYEILWNHNFSASKIYEILWIIWIHKYS